MRNSRSRCTATPIKYENKLRTRVWFCRFLEVQDSGTNLIELWCFNLCLFVCVCIHWNVQSSLISQIQMEWQESIKRQYYQLCTNRDTDKRITERNVFLVGIGNKKLIFFLIFFFFFVMAKYTNIKPFEAAKLKQKLYITASRTE